MQLHVHEPDMKLNADAELFSGCRWRTRFKQSAACAEAPRASGASRPCPSEALVLIRGACSTSTAKFLSVRGCLPQELQRQSADGSAWRRAGMPFIGWSAVVLGSTHFRGTSAPPAATRTLPAAGAAISASRGPEHHNPRFLLLIFWGSGAKSLVAIFT